MLHPITRLLKELTEVDALRVEIDEQLARYPKMLADLDKQAAAARKAVSDAEAAIAAALKRRRAAEQETSDLRTRIKRYEVQQSQVKTAKEAEAMTHEIEQLTARIDVLETEGLELLEIEETQGRILEKARRAEAALEIEQSPERERITEQIREKRGRRERLLSEAERRLQALPSHPDDWQQDYLLLNQRHPGSVVVPVKGSQCGGCHFSLTAGQSQVVAAGKAVVHCDHCRRILYVE